MKRFEAIEEEIEYLEILNSSDNKQLLSELKQITDEHSEMVEMIKESKKTIKWYMENCIPENNLYEDFFNLGMNNRQPINTFLTKINDK